MFMNDQTQAVDNLKMAADLFSKISGGQLSEAELKDAKKTLKKIQLIATKEIERIDNQLPSLTDKEKTLVNSQKMTLGEIVIAQVFADTSREKNALSEEERQQFLALTLKLVLGESKAVQKRILQDSNNLNEGLYLNSEKARKAKLKK